MMILSKRGLVIFIALEFLSLSLIGLGLYRIYPPAAAIVVGGLVWIDLFLFTLGVKK